MTTNDEPLEIRTAGDPVLRRACRPLAPEEIRGAEVQALIARMRSTMRAAPGVGLAAPQVGHELQLTVIEDRAEYQSDIPPAVLAEREREPVEFHVVINPLLTVEDAELVAFHEGCLSVPGYAAMVPRARAVRVECLDARGEPRVIRARGWYARILQHEIDHLQGVLYVDRMHPRTFTTIERYRAAERGARHSVPGAG